MTDEEKAEMLVQNFVINEVGRKGREATIDENEELLLQDEDANDLINVSFTKAELNRALQKTKTSSPGKDQMLRYVKSSS